jgi:hypothetical protein
MATLSNKWLLGLFVGALCVITVVLLLPTDVPSEVPPPLPEPGPSPSMAPSATAVVDPQVWFLVEDPSELVGGWKVSEGYDMAGSPLQLYKGDKAPLYPYSFLFEPNDAEAASLSCGFYSRVEEGWRLAYCSGYTLGPGIAPFRIMFHVTPGNDYLRLQVGDLIELHLERR